MREDMYRCIAIIFGCLLGYFFCGYQIYAHIYSVDVEQVGKLPQLQNK